MRQKICLIQVVCGLGIAFFWFSQLDVLDFSVESQFWLAASWIVSGVVVALLGYAIADHRFDQLCFLGQWSEGFQFLGAAIFIAGAAVDASLILPVWLSNLLFVLAMSGVLLAVLSAFVSWLSLAAEGGD